MRYYLPILGCLVLLATPLTSQAQNARAGRAYLGEPFGVASVVVPATWPVGDANIEGFRVTDDEGRVFYPVFAKGVLQRLLNDLLGGGQTTGPGVVTALFLFKGDDPLTVTLHTPTPTTVTLRPVEPQGRQRMQLRQQWWREFDGAAQKRLEAGSYPPLVHNFLTGMLERRLGLAPPLRGRETADATSETMKTMDLIAGSEALRARILRESIATPRQIEDADQPVPGEVVWAEQVEPAGLPESNVEPMAMHVPHECFYVRFGSFNNYMWLTKLTDEYGGEIGQMVQMQGHNFGLDQRMETQLALKQSALADLLGGQVISDMAFVGRDAYLREGAALGLLFEARSPLLTSDIKTQRANSLKKFEDRGAKEVIVKIAGRDVPFLSTPDNRLRSFLAIHGKYHLVTTSREMARRFFEASDGKDALGASAEFRQARRKMPRARRDTVFAYFSRRFIQGLVSPQYQIELSRRLRAVTDLDIIAMARLAGKMEGVEDLSVQGLIEAGILPENFDHRPDGSRLVLSDGRAVDSLRGGRGSFLPIPDVPIKAVTAEEAKEYAAKAAHYAGVLKQMDPLMVGVKRTVVDPKGREHLSIDAHLSLMDESKYGWALSVLGPATKQTIVPTPDEIVSASAFVQGGLLDASVPPHHLFIGVLDSPPGTDLNPTGLLKTLRILQTTPGFLGAYPKPGFLDRLPFGLGGGEPDVNGYSRLPLGLLRRQFGQYSLLSFDHGVLEHVSPDMQIGEADSPAQFRMHVGDLSTAKIRGWVNDLYYQRARQTSVGNLLLLDTLQQQLGVPVDEALTSAEDLLDAQLTCALKGRYKLVTDSQGRKVWTSNKLEATNETPEKFVAPLIGWFRGLDASLVKTETGLHLHADLDMRRKPQLGNIFNLFVKKKPAAPKPKVDEKKKKEF